jgi:hypothetical protein
MGSLAPAQTSVFIYYDTHNCIFPLYSIGGTGYMTSECWFGQRVHIIVIGLDLNGKVYSSIQSVTVAANLVVTATVVPTTAAAVVAQIAALP